MILNKLHFCLRKILSSFNHEKSLKHLHFNLISFLYFTDKITLKFVCTCTLKGIFNRNVCLFYRKMQYNYQYLCDFLYCIEWKNIYNWITFIPDDTCQKQSKRTKICITIKFRDKFYCCSLAYEQHLTMLSHKKKFSVSCRLFVSLFVVRCVK